MTRGLHGDIRQRRPFRSAEQEVHLNLVRTASVLNDAIEPVFREAGITGTQYNVLRILQGAEPTGMCRNEVRDRMLTRMPDMTRLLDRMEEAGLVSRTRHADDRRMVATRITPRGRRLVADLEQPVLDAHKRLLGHLTRAQLAALVELLTLARSSS